MKLSPKPGFQNRRNGFCVDSQLLFGSQLNRAFTIIEILLALGIFMLVIFAIYGSWSAVLRSSRAGLTVAAEAQRSRIAMRTIEDALLTAQMFGENSRYYTFESDTTDENLHFLSFTARLPESFPGSGMFGDAVMRRITFEVLPGVESGNDLVMTQFPLLLMTNVDMQPYPITLAKDISLFILEFWDTQQGDWMADFLTTNQLPKMMRVTLGLGHSPQHPQEPDEVISRIIALPSMVVMGEMQFTPGQSGQGQGQGLGQGQGQGQGLGQGQGQGFGQGQGQGLGQGKGFGKGQGQGLGQGQGFGQGRPGIVPGQGLRPDQNQRPGSGGPVGGNSGNPSPRRR